MKGITFCILLLCLTDCTAQSKKEVFKTYFPDGKLKAVTEMENGKKNGKEELYWENGNIFMRQYYKDDIPIDSFFQYHENPANEIFIRGYCIPKAHIIIIDSVGRIVGENDYIAKMIADGLIKIYYNNQRLASITDYRNGKKNGISTLYFLNGNVKVIEHYKDGIKIPPIIEFDSFGRVLKYIPVR